MSIATKSSSYELEWEFLPRLATDHLGKNKYTTSARALGELVANALDAGATVVDIEIGRNEMNGVSYVLVKDNGRGMSPTELKRRFVVVGVMPEVAQKRDFHLGRFGVGRLGVHRIGNLSHWTTIAQVSGERIKSCFSLLPEDKGKLRIEQSGVPRSTSTGTSIEVRNILENSADSFSDIRLQYDLLAQFCAYLLANKDRRIRVNGSILAVEELVDQRESEKLTGPPDVGNAQMDHLLLKRALDQTRFPGQVLFTALGRTVATARPETTPGAHYLGIVHCPYLDNLVSANRESLIELDGGFTELRAAALTRVQVFTHRFESTRKHHFIEKAREQDYYPYRIAATDPVTIVKQQVYDVVLGEVHRHANLETMTAKQKEVVFRLLHRSMENQNLLEILHEVAKLSDEDMEKFRRVLERTTLDSIIKLSSEVTSRIQFLDYLNDLCYGEVSKRLKERTQLHKILEPHAWIFGPQFHLATSDRSFREVVRKHRKLAKLADADEAKLYEAKDLNDVPDLFLAATRSYPISPKNHHMLVELKSPRVPMGAKEIVQARRYAQTIVKSDECDKSDTRWDIFLVSSKATDEIELDRSQEDRPYGFIGTWSRVSVWAFKWCELITRAREEMSLVRDHLEMRSQELKASDFLRENYPEILNDIEKPKITSTQSKPRDSALPRKKTSRKRTAKRKKASTKPRRRAD